MQDGLVRCKKEGGTRGTNLDVPEVERKEDDHDDDLSISERCIFSQENLSSASNRPPQLTLKT